MKQNVSHSNDKYVRQCAHSDLMWFERQGLEPPQHLAVDVLKIGSLELIRTLQCETAKIRVGDFGGFRRQASEP